MRNSHALGPGHVGSLLLEDRMATSCTVFARRLYLVDLVVSSYRFVGIGFGP